MHNGFAVRLVTYTQSSVVCSYDDVTVKTQLIRREEVVPEIVEVRWGILSVDTAGAVGPCDDRIAVRLRERHVGPQYRCRSGDWVAVQILRDVHDPRQGCGRGQKIACYICVYFDFQQGARLRLCSIRWDGVERVIRDRPVDPRCLFELDRVNYWTWKCINDRVRKSGVVQLYTTRHDEMKEEVSFWSSRLTVDRELIFVVEEEVRTNEVYPQVLALQKGKLQF